ncbi:MAG TPA: hypothetical protein VFW71_13880 [Actinomycetota bacterium]|nr:hypothetical protein [Actinomycetota bacterium]
MAVAPPTAEAVVAIWERGRDEHPVDRALTVLAGCCGAPRAELAGWPLERRDAALAAYRASLFGPRWDGYAACPACGCGVDVALALPEHRTGEARVDGDVEAEEGFAVEVDARCFAVRLPTSRDLAAAAACASIEQARAVLVRGCAGAGEPGEALLEALEAELDRRAELSAGVVALTCPDCAEAWSLEMDVAAFFWRELEVLAGRLLREVDALARRYGWSEAEILALSPARRGFYLELAS